MALAEQVRVELVDVVHLFAADIALPRIALAVTALVQEVQCLVGELDAAEQALQVPLAVQRNQVALRPRRRDDPVGRGAHQAGRVRAPRSVIVVVRRVTAHSGCGRRRGSRIRRVAVVVVVVRIVARRSVAGPGIDAPLQVFPEQ